MVGKPGIDEKILYSGLYLRFRRFVRKGETFETPSRTKNPIQKMTQ